MIRNRAVEKAPWNRINQEIAIVPPKTIPRSEGKAVRVVERR